MKYKYLYQTKENENQEGEILLAVCDYEASHTAPKPPIWNEGYPVWWHLSNVRLLDNPISCRGNVGMWQLPKEVANLISP